MCLPGISRNEILRVFTASEDEKLTVIFRRTIDENFIDENVISI